MILRPTELVRVTVPLTLLLLLGAAPAHAQGDAAGTEESAAAEQAAAPTPQHKCFATGEPWDPSPTRVEAVFRERGQLKRARFINLGYFVAALKTFEEESRGLALVQLSIVDYPSVGTGAEQMVEIDLETQNVWLVHTDSKLPNTRGPYIVGFSDEQAAKDWAASRGGKVMSYEKALAKIAGELNRTPETDAFAEELMN